MKPTQQLQEAKGSLKQTSGKKSVTLAEAFLTVKALVICDISGSMAARDVNAEGGPRSRWEEANAQLAKLQAKFPGQLGVVAFSDGAQFCPNGILPPIQGGTDMMGGLQFVAPADGCGIKFIVVSDGCPDNPEGTLSYAKTLQQPIDAIYIGTDVRGKEFMERLAKATKGKTITKGVELLEQSVTLLLGDGK